MTEKDALHILIKAIKKSKLIVNGQITGAEEEYELISYVDEIVVEDEYGQTVVSLPRDSNEDSEG
jgi:predicted ATPase